MKRDKANEVNEVNEVKIEKASVVRKRTLPLYTKRINKTVQVELSIIQQAVKVAEESGRMDCMWLITYVERDVQKIVHKKLTSLGYKIKKTPACWYIIF